MKKIFKLIIVISICLLNLTVIQAKEEDGQNYTLEPSTLIVNSQYDSEVGFLNNMVFCKGENKVGKNLYIINDGGYSPGKAGVYSIEIGVKDKPSFRGRVQLTVVQSKGKIIDINKNGTSILKLSDDYFNGNELNQEKFMKTYGIDNTVVEMEKSDGNIYSENYTLPIMRVQWKGAGEQEDSVSSLRFYLGKDTENEYSGYSQMFNYVASSTNPEHYQYYAPEYLGYGLPIYKASELTNLNKKSENSAVSLYYQSRDFYPNVKMISATIQESLPLEYKNKVIDVKVLGATYNFKMDYDAQETEDIVTARSLYEVELGFKIPDGFDANMTELYSANDRELKFPLPVKLKNNEIVYKTRDVNESYILVDKTSIDKTGNTGLSKVPEVKIDLGDKSIESILPLTQEEQQSIANGSKLDMLLSVNDKIDEKIKQNTITKVKDQLTDYQHIGLILDISIIKQIGIHQSLVPNLKQPIKLVITIPDALAGKKKYMVYRIHNGKLEVLSDLDNNPNTITISTDRFSMYAIVYENDENDLIKTGDDKSLLYPSCTLLISVIAISLIKRRYENNI